MTKNPGMAEVPSRNLASRPFIHKPVLYGFYYL